MDPKQYLTDLSQRVNQIHFLEIGAMDGKSFDLLHEMIHRYKWTGVLVEPLPDLFEELKNNYVDCEGNFRKRRHYWTSWIP